MAFKIFELSGIGPVTIYKRKGARNLRLTIAADGRTKVTMPYYSPYAAGLAFAESRRSWIMTHTAAPQATIEPGQRIGKAHRIVFLPGIYQAVTSRVAGSEVRVQYPAEMSQRHQAVQTVAQSASLRALRLQANKLLPGRLRRLAELHGFQYTSVNVKQLTGRWGSCDNQQRIVLNLFLMQLPWHLIDYVLIHELIHIKHMNHGPEFWEAFTNVEPRAKALRREIKQCKPILTPMSHQDVA